MQVPVLAGSDVVLALVHHARIPESALKMTAGNSEDPGDETKSSSSWANEKIFAFLLGLTDQNINQLLETLAKFQKLDPSDAAITTKMFIAAVLKSYSF